MNLDDCSFNVEALKMGSRCGTCDVVTPYGLIQVTRHHNAYSIYAPALNFGGGLYDEESAVKTVNGLILHAKSLASSHTDKE